MPRRLGSLALCLLLTAPAAAEVRLAPVFGDCMVLQRDRPLPVWGRAAPGETVRIQIAEHTVEATADAAGAWRVSLPALPAGGPHELVVRASERTLTLKDVLIGEVWLCSGQSNMSWPLRRSANPEREVAAADHPQLRLCTVTRQISEEPSASVRASWAVSTPKSAAPFSAVAYHFGRELQQALGVPVGLVHASWGGTCVETWIPRPALRASKPAAPLLARWSRSIAAYDPDRAQAAYAARLEAWKAARKGEGPREHTVAAGDTLFGLARTYGVTLAALRAANGLGPDDERLAPGQALKIPPRTRKPLKPRRPEDPRRARWRPGNLYNGMIHPLVPFAFRGTIWYQGEANAPRAHQYRHLFGLLIRSWRAAFEQEELPFYFVQLANFRARAKRPGPSAWAELREAQALALALPKTGMAVAIDIGDAKDIHPRNKREVGRRLALLALARTYGHERACAGPQLTSHAVEGAELVLEFDAPLVARGGELRGFTLAGADRVFHRALAELDGDRVRLSSPAVPAPAAARYGWADNPDCTLVNQADLPASPFRTDDWPLTTVGKH